MERIAPRLRRAARRPVVLAALLLVALAVLAVPAALAQLQAAPVNTAQPTISGSPLVGQTLTATQGTWSNSPTSYSYQWVRCPASGGASDGSDCAVIGGATTTAYIAASGDVGSRLRVRVTASNADGSDTSASNATAAVATTAAPVNSALPTISGSTIVGSTLTATQGTWSGTGNTYAYAWQRCNATGASCAPIASATGQTYVLTATDAADTIRVAVTATNAAGNATATSAQTAVIAATAANGCPTGTGTIDVDRLAPPARLSIDRQSITPSVVVRDTRTIRLRFRVSACGGRPVEGALVYATPTPYQQFSTSEQPTANDGFAILTLSRGRFFPASQQQQNLVVFVRARKSGEDLLGGISNRRLVSFRVDLNG